MEPSKEHTESNSQLEQAFAPEPAPSPEPTPEPTSKPESTIPTPSPESPTPALDSTEPSPTPESPAPAKKSKKLLIALLIILIVLIAGAGCLAWFMFSGNSEPSQDEQSPDAQEPASYDLGQLSDFDFTFLRLATEDATAKDNIIYSPLSIKYALAMLSEATAGESKTQITNLIGDYQPKSYANSSHRSIANAMFIRDSVKEYILDSYTQTLKQKFDAEVVNESFQSVEPFNQWVSDKTLGIVNNIFDETALDGDFILANALAIDMNWNNQLQCFYNPTKDMPCKNYSVNYYNENYSDSVEILGISHTEFDKINFNNQEVDSARIGASVNRYDIVNELGEEYIRSTVQAAYDEWLAEVQKDTENIDQYDTEFDIDLYMERLNSNYGQIATSTDFYFLDTDNEKVFAKDLQEYDGSVLQYVGIMPKNQDLNTYIDALTVEKAANLIGGLKDSSVMSNYTDRTVTKISAHIPFFNFNYDLGIREDLQILGVNDIFDFNVADLSNLTNLPESYIQDVVHKADIDFSNDGIKAAATTGIVGGLGAAHPKYFEYKWDVPVEEINLTFDQPFLFLIRDKSSGEAWFIGAVYHPAES
ncbi:hypothetical protein IJF93_00360 [Candidatus Saccharibacteria bacterium]|nr:hypothetical protein [Candidatus Saccharibacteria bacterium]